ISASKAGSTCPEAACVARSCWSNEALLIAAHLLTSRNAIRNWAGRRDGLLLRSGRLPVVDAEDAEGIGLSGGDLRLLLTDRVGGGLSAFAGEVVPLRLGASHALRLKVGLLGGIDRARSDAGVILPRINPVRHGEDGGIEPHRVCRGLH